MSHRMAVWLPSCQMCTLSLEPKLERVCCTGRQARPGTPCEGHGRAQAHLQNQGGDREEQGGNRPHRWHLVGGRLCGAHGAVLGLHQQPGLSGDWVGRDQLNFLQGVGLIAWRQLICSGNESLIGGVVRQLPRG